MVNFKEVVFDFLKARSMKSNGLPSRLIRSTRSGVPFAAINTSIA